MAEIERIYTIPLRKEWIKVARAKRANKAMATIKNFINRHVKAEKVKIDPDVSKFVFSHNIKKPPGRIKVMVSGDKKEVKVKLFEEESRAEPAEKEEKKETNEEKNKKSK